MILLNQQILLKILILPDCALKVMEITLLIYIFNQGPAAALCHQQIWSLLTYFLLKTKMFIYFLAAFENQ